MRHIATKLFATAILIGTLARGSDRIGEINLNEVFVDPGTRTHALQGAIDIGPASAEMVRTVTVHFTRTPAQETELQTLMRQQRDSASSRFHKFLTPEGYAAKFGLSESDSQKIVQWLAQAGFSDIKMSRGRSYATASGSVAQIQQALAIQLRSVNVNGRTHVANMQDIALPKALRGVVSGIRGLDDLHPHHVGPSPRYTSALSGQHYLTPADLATIYDMQALYGSGVNGSGVKIAVTGQSDIDLTTIDRFRTAAQLPATTVTVAQAGGNDPGYNSADEKEAELDLEWSGGVAPGAALTYVVSDDVFTSLAYAIDNKVASIVIMSFGVCEQDMISASTIEAELTKAAAEGITVVAAAGDFGAADCDAGAQVATATQGTAVDYPASSSYVVAVGGSEFIDQSGTYWAETTTPSGQSALQYIPETAWNDSTSSQITASGGGASFMFPKPSWQAGIGVPADAHRDVPDIAMPASAQHDGYVVCVATQDCTAGFRASDGTLEVKGGTSVGAPVFAGILALLYQKTGSQGLINERLYQLASISSDAFHDITTGNNMVSCATASPDCSDGKLGYSAGVGYDQVTGLGSVDVSKMISEWSADYSVSAPSTVTVARGGSGTANISVTSTGGFSGTVQFTCSVSSSLPNTTCSIPGTVTANGSTMLTLQNTNTSLFSPVPLDIPAYGRPLLIGMAATLLVALVRKHRQTLAYATICCCLATAGCGNGSSSPNTAVTITPVPVTGSITITAASGLVSHSTTVSVTLQ